MENSYFFRTPKTKEIEVKIAKVVWANDPQKLWNIIGRLKVMYAKKI